MELHELRRCWTRLRGMFGDAIVDWMDVDEGRETPILAYPSFQGDPAGRVWDAA